MNTTLDNEVLDQPTIAPDSVYFNVKGTTVQSIATANDALVTKEPPSNGVPDPQYNKVTLTQSGHVQEWDDTPGAERICTFHKDGHFVEFSKNGQVTKIFGDDFEIILQDKTLSVSGNLNITVNGDCNMLIAGNATTKIQGSDTRYVAGSSTTYVKGTYNVISEQNMLVESLQNITTKSRGNTLIFSFGSLTLDGKTSLTQTTGGNLSSTAGGTITLASGGNLSTIAGANMYSLVGEERFSTSNSGSTVSFSSPTVPTPVAIPTSSSTQFGLGFVGSLIQPSAAELFILKSESPSTLCLRDPKTTYPSNRTVLPVGSTSLF